VSGTERIAPNSVPPPDVLARKPHGQIEPGAAPSNHETEDPVVTLERRRTIAVRKLLDGATVEPVEFLECRYDLQTSWHLGVIAADSTGRDALLRVSSYIGCRLLQVTASDEMIWAWLGSPRPINVPETEHFLSVQPAMSGPLAIGGPRLGLDGWRQTHREAKGALRRALRSPEKVVRYGDRPLLAAALADETVVMWLTAFVEPIRNRPDGGVALLSTLRAYIDTGCNSSSAASKLGVRRQTVGTRLQMVERLLNRSLHTCLAEVDLAVQLVEATADPACPASRSCHL
jgi:hypothetical protein